MEPAHAYTVDETDTARRVLLNNDSTKFSLCSMLSGGGATIKLRATIAATIATIVADLTVYSLCNWQPYSQVMVQRPGQ